MRLRNCPPALHRLAFVADSMEEVNRTKGVVGKSRRRLERESSAVLSAIEFGWRAPQCPSDYR